tara:strand:+ start:255 stop:572 length:318 start_codon:yes stop_codon:yes gene_type:complete
MKITKTQLKQIIKEEIGRVISESRRSYASQDMIEDYAAGLYMRPEALDLRGPQHREYVKKVNKIVRWIKSNSSNIKSTKLAIAQADENLESGKPLPWRKPKSGKF